MKPSLILRADAGSVIGTGHVMRCLALAQAWQDAGGRAVFASALMPELLAQRLEQEDVAHSQLRAVVGSRDDAEETIAVVEQHEAAWLVVDGYRFSPEYFEHIAAAGIRILALDDMAHLERYPVEVLLNQNLSATFARYAGKVGDDCELLLGPKFSLLRREFRQAPEIVSAHECKRVLITFGGGDAENFTGRLLTHLARSDRRDLEVVVLAGAANPHVAALRQAAAQAPFRCEVRVNVQDVATVMAWADVAITAAGSTVWELAALRVPALVGAFEENQLVGLNALRRVPLFRARRVEELLDCDLAAELDALPARPDAAGDFDAWGAMRVVEHLKSADVRTSLALASA